MAQVSRPHTFPNAKEAWVEPEDEDDDHDNANDDDHHHGEDEDHENGAWVKPAIKWKLVIKSKVLSVDVIKICLEPSPWKEMCEQTSC